MYVTTFQVPPPRHPIVHVRIAEFVLDVEQRVYCDPAFVIRVPDAHFLATNDLLHVVSGVAFK